MGLFTIQGVKRMKVRFLLLGKAYMSEHY